MKTIYSILIISFFIGYTSAQERDSIVGGWEYPQNFYELYRLNAKGEKLTTHSNVFTIIKKPQSSYMGTYQKGQPYEGFFIQKGKMPLNFRVDEYEKGKKIKEYCFAPLGKENNNYPIKLDEIAKVENGQAVTDGTVFKERKIDKVTYLTITNYKNGSPHKCLFVMYHDIINAWLFSLEKDFITVAYEDKEDLMNLKIYKKDDELVGDLLSGGRTFHTRKHSITVEKGTPNASIYCPPKGNERKARMIRLKGIRKSYNGREVLKGIDLEIVDQDYLVILGASGSGKSTLLNVLSGLEKPDSGHVYYDEEDLSQLTEAQLTAFRRAQIAFIFQQYFLLPNLTVEQNVKMGANLAGNQDYVRILEALGLGDKLQHYPSQLSGGEQQRVAIARALAKRPNVLFLDEPTGALDEATGRQILAYISSLQEELGFTLVMVTHNANIAQMAKTIVHINSGQIQSLETNSQPKTAYEIGW